MKNKQTTLDHHRKMKKEEREAQEGGDKGIIMADLHCCMAEMNTTF